MNSDSPIHVCYFGTYRENYSRNQIMIAGLRLNGVIVSECHETLWHGIEDRVRIASGGWLKPSFWWRIISVYLQLIIHYSRIGHYDVMIVGYPGQFDIFLARILAWISHKPLVWDVFMSIYLISVERGLNKSSMYSVKLLRLLEGLGLKLPDRLIIDTNEYLQWFTQNYGIHPERFRVVPTGADDRVFFPIQNSPKMDEKFRIIYFGTFIPNHGVMYILEAAKLLQNEKQILFELIGKGPDLEPAQQFVIKHQLDNVLFFEWMEKDELIDRINQADVCLGAFGTTPQSLMTVQNKIYEAMAMMKPLISGDSPAIRQVFTDNEHILLCERANPSSLVKAIRYLNNNPKISKQLAENGYARFIENFRITRLGELYLQHLEEIIK